jgi:hypothetical protein
MPEALSAPVPSVVAPSLKVTVPVGVPAVEVAVAVNVTDCPNLLGFSDEVRVVELAAGFTVCVSAVEVLVEKVASPP